MRTGEKTDFSLRFPRDGSEFRRQDTRGDRRRESEEERTEKREIMREKEEGMGEERRRGI